MMTKPIKCDRLIFTILSSVLVDIIYKMILLKIYIVTRHFQREERMLYIIYNHQLKLICIFSKTHYSDFVRDKVVNTLSFKKLIQCTRSSIFPFLIFKENI